MTPYYLCYSIHITSSGFSTPAFFGGRRGRCQMKQK